MTTKSGRKPIQVFLVHQVQSFNGESFDCFTVSKIKFKNGSIIKTTTHDCLAPAETGWTETDTGRLIEFQTPSVH